jgi:hypothetical protein
MGKRWTNRLAVRRRGLAVRNWRIVMSAVTGVVVNCASANLQDAINNDSSVASLHTAAAKQLADETLAQNSLDWPQRARHTKPPELDQP